jgi:hypothetical protein
MDAARAAYDEVYVYTMGRPRFILQHVVDAFAAQTATDDSKPWCKSLPYPCPLSTKGLREGRVRAA